MGNRQRIETKLMVPVVDCDGCGDEIWEIAAHSVFATPFHEIDWNSGPQGRHRDMCDDCCPGTCIDADNLHG